MKWQSFYIIPSSAPSTGWMVLRFIEADGLKFRKLWEQIFELWVRIVGKYNKSDLFDLKQQTKINTLNVSYLNFITKVFPFKKI